MKTVDVIPLVRLPWNAPITFTYAVPEGLPPLLPGMWVWVPFRARAVPALVTDTATSKAHGRQLRAILRHEPLLPLPPPFVQFITRAATMTFNHPVRFLHHARSKTQSMVSESSFTPLPSKARQRLIWWGDLKERDDALIARAKQFIHGQHLILAPTIEHAYMIHAMLARACCAPLHLYQPRASRTEAAALNGTLAVGKPATVVGTRTALFLPFARLTGITMDDEAHWAYRQESPPPRYHARRLVSLLASLHGTDCAFVSATPSVASYQRWVKEKKGTPHSPPHRSIEIIDRTSFYSFAHPISPLVVNELRSMVHTHESVLILTDARGYAPLLHCKDCGYLFRCARCANILGKEDSAGRELSCNRCGYREMIPPFCPHCHGVRLTHAGFGPARMIEYLQSENISASLLAAASESSGCHVGTLGEETHRASWDAIICVNVDALFARPGFASFEGALRTLMPLMHATAQGRLVVQTAVPDHPVLKSLAGDLRTFYREDLQLRKKLHYPPFAILIRIILPTATEKQKNIAQQASQGVVNALKGDVWELIPSPRTHRRRKPVLSFTLRYPAPDVSKTHLREINTLLRKVLPSNAIIDTDPESI